MVCCSSLSHLITAARPDQSNICLTLNLPTSQVPLIRHHLLAPWPCLVVIKKKTTINMVYSVSTSKVECYECWTKKIFFPKKNNQKKSFEFQINLKLTKMSTYLPQLKQIQFFRQQRDILFEVDGTEISSVGTDGSVSAADGVGTPINCSSISSCSSSSSSASKSSWKKRTSKPCYNVVLVHQ